MHSKDVMVLMLAILLSACTGPSLNTLKQDAQPSTDRYTQQAQTPVSEQHLQEITENAHYNTLGQNSIIPAAVESSASSKVSSASDLQNTLNQSLQYSQQQNLSLPSNGQIQPNTLPLPSLPNGSK